MIRCKRRSDVSTSGRGRRRRSRQIPAVDRSPDESARTTRKGSRDLELRKLLRRFLDVCNAIDYAHSRGVLHRDIKPANIILGKHGETLVVDWGLAKATGKGDASAGERTMTPSSASGSAETLPGFGHGHARLHEPRAGPRRDRPARAAVGCVQPGRDPLLPAHRRAADPERGPGVDPPCRADTEHFPPPRRLDPRIDRTLEAVCLKAMALEPDDRYASPRALADDIERWMADDPVTALARWLGTASRSLVAPASLGDPGGRRLAGRDRHRRHAGRPGDRPGTSSNP